MATVALLLGTVGLALCALVVIGLMLAVVKAVLPHDPPIDALYGDSLMSRMKALKHEYDNPYVIGGKPSF